MRKLTKYEEKIIKEMERGPPWLWELGPDDPIPDWVFCGTLSRKITSQD